MTLSLLIPESVFPALEKKFEKLSKKAGVPFMLVDGITFLSIPSTKLVQNLATLEYSQVRDRPEVLACKRVTIGDLPRIAGYALLARIEHTEAGNIVNSVPGEELPESYRTAEPACQHCGHKRNRKDTFVLRAPDGSLAQVGRNCLADFLHVDASQMVKLAEHAAWVAEHCAPGNLVEAWGGGGRGTLPTRDFLACAVASVEEHGYVRTDGDRPTRLDASWRCRPPFDNERMNEWLKNQPTKEHYATADEIVVWSQRRVDDEQESQYQHNLRVALACLGVGKNEGLVASAPAAYMKACGITAERKEKAKRNAEAPDAGYLAAVGTRVEFTATLLRRVDIERENSQWGNPTLLVFRTEAGHDVAWFCSGNLPRVNLQENASGEGASRSCAPGDTLKLKGTVKKTEMYKGRHQTTVSRCVVLS